MEMRLFGNGTSIVQDGGQFQTDKVLQQIA